MNIIGIIGSFVFISVNTPTRLQMNEHHILIDVHIILFMTPFQLIQYEK